MIVRPRPNWIHMLFVRRGSMVKKLLPQQIFMLLLSVCVVLIHGTLFAWKVPLTAGPFALMGVALAIFLGFRINASYDRYWEARKFWGAVLVECRNLTRQVINNLGSEEAVREVAYGLISFANAMRNQFRGLANANGIEELLPSGLLEEINDKRFAPVAILSWLGSYLRAQKLEGSADQILSFRIGVDRSLDNLSAALGGCERIASTPLPFTYKVILHRSAYFYCVLLPFGLVDTIGWATPLVVTFISYTFFALEALSDEIDDPFGTSANDIAQDAIVFSIDSSLREMIGESVQAPMQPNKDYVLT